MTAANFDRLPTARRRSRGALLGRTALCGVLSLGVAAAIAARPAKAGPAGGTVVQGGAAIQTTGSHTEITQSTQNALITWQDFSIDSTESVNFAQPNSRAVALNKVLSNIPTEIQGALTANGQVWIVNPNGVFVGDGAAVNVGGLIATSADLVAQDWDAGKYTFAGAPDGSQVDISGAVTATDGSIVLVAPMVDVSGSLTAAGDVAAGAGSGFAVDFVGDGLTRFAVDAASGARLNVTGAISAQGGAAYLVGAATDAVEDAVVSIGGQVEATRIEERGGVIVISGGDNGVTEVSGTVDASQAEGAGGSVTITGGRIALAGTAVVDASGATGGGTVEIGGGFQGAALASDVVSVGLAPEMAPLPTARRTYVAEGARIAANAGEAGDGGRVIVWADEITGFSGAISAIAGATGGDGGFAEVSGKLSLGFDGEVDLTAAFGSAGTLLLDPDNIIVADEDVGNADNGLVDNEILFDDPGATLTISNEAIEQRGGNLTLQATQTITVNHAIDDTGEDNSTTSVTFQANDIAINEDITLGGDFVVQAANNIAIGNNNQNGGDDLTIAGNLTLAANVDLSSFVSGPSPSGSGTITFANSADISAADVTLSTSGGISLRNITATTGNFSLTAGGNVGQVNGTSLDIAGQATVSAPTFNVTLDEAGNDFVGAVSILGASVQIADTNNVVLGDLDVTGNLVVAAGGGISDTSGSVNAVGEGVNVTGTTSLAAGNNSDIILDSAFHDFGGTVTIDNPGGNNDTNNVTIYDINNLTLANLVVDEDVTLQAGGLLTVGSIDLDDGSDTISLSGSDLQIGGAITDADVVQIANISTVDASVALGSGDQAMDITNAELNLIASPVTITGGAFDINGVSFDQDLEIVAAGAVGQSGAFTLSGMSDLTVLAAGRDVTLANPANDFTGTVNIKGANITLDDDGSIVLGDIDASGALTVNADDGISQTAAAEAGAAVDVTGNATFTTDATGNDDIALDSEFNTFAGTIDLTGNDVTVTGASALTVAGLSADDATLTAGGAIDSTGAVVLAAAGTLTANTDGDAISFGDPGNVIGTFVADTDPGDDGGEAAVAVQDSGALELGAIDASDLTVTAGGEITQSGDVSATGDVTLSATGFDILLSDPGNDFGTVSAEGLNIDLEDANTITLADIDAAGTLKVEAAESLLDNDPTVDGEGVDVALTATLIAGVGFDLLLDAPGVNFAGVHDIGGVVTVADVTTPNTVANFGLVEQGSLDLDAGIGTISASESITLGGSNISLTGVALDAPSVTLQSTTGDIVLLADGYVLNPDPLLEPFTGFLQVRESDVAGITDLGLLASGQVFVDGASFTSGDLTLGAGTSLTVRDSQALAASLSFGSTPDHDLSLTAGTTVGVFEVLSVTGNLSVDAGSSVLFSNNLTVGNDLSVTAGTFIAFSDDVGVTNNATITAGTVVDINGPPLSFFDVSGNLSINAVDVNVDSQTLVQGNLQVTASGAVTQSESIFVVGSSAFLGGSGSVFTLDDTGNDFDSDETGDPIVAMLGDGQLILFDNSGTLNLGDITAGSLHIETDGGSINQIGAAISVSGDAAFIADDLDPASVTLNGPLNDFSDGVGTFSAQADEVSVNDMSGINLGAIEADNVTVAALGPITDDFISISPIGFGPNFSRIDVNNAMTLTAGAGTDITLDLAGHDLGTVSASGQNILLTDGGALTLAAVNAAGDLTIATGGSLTDTTGAAISVSGTTSISAGTFDVALDNAGVHDFNRVDITAGDITIDDMNGIALGAIATQADAILPIDTTINTNGGDLTLRAGGSVTDTAGEAVLVAGLTSISAGTFDVALDNADLHDFHQINITGGDIVVDDVNGIQLGAIKAQLNVDPTIAANDGSLTVRAGGAVTDTATEAVVVAGMTSITAENTASTIFFDVELDNVALHDFNEVDVSAGDITLDDANAITLGAVTARVNTDPTIASNDGSLTVNAGTSVNLTEPASISGALSVDAGTDITVGSPVTVGGGATLAAIGGFLNVFGNLSVANDLDADAFSFVAIGGTNSVGGTLTADSATSFVYLYGSNSIAGDLDIHAATTADLSDAITVGNDLLVNAGTSIVDSGVGGITVSGNTDLNAPTITLDGTGNSFGDAVTDIVNASGTDIILKDTGPLRLGSVNTAGNMTVTAGGVIDDNGTGITVSGTLSANTEGFAITLDEADNAIGTFAADTDLADDGGEANVTVRDGGALALGAIDANDLTVTTGGTLTDTAAAAIVVAGLTSISAGTFDVALDTADTHDFNEVDITAGDITIDDVDDIVLGTLNAQVNGDPTIATNLGDLVVRAGDAVTDVNAEAINVAGATTITAQNPAGTTFFDVTLDGPNHDFDNNALGIDSTAGDAFDSVNVTGDNITLKDVDAIALGNIQADGAFTLTAGGSVTDTGAAISVGGVTSISAGTFDVALDTPGTHDFNEVDIAGGDVTIDDVDDIQLGTITTNANADPTIASNDGSLIVRAGGAVTDTDSEAVLVAGATSVSAGTFDVALDNVDLHDFNRIDVTGGDITIDDVDDVQLGAITAQANADPTIGADDGSLDVAAGGAITDTASAPITVAGTTTLVAQNGSNYFDVVLDNTLGLTAVTTTGSDPGTPIHNFGTSIDVEGEDIRIRNAGDITVTATGHDDTAVASSDPTIGLEYPVSIDNGSGPTSQTATISPDGSVVIQSDGLLAIDQVVADQDVLLATDTNFSILSEGVPVRSNHGDIWMAALQGSFVMGSERQIPAGTLFSAPEGNIAIFVKDAFRMVLDPQGGVNSEILDPLAPEPPVDQQPGEPGYQALPDPYVNVGLVLETSPTGIGLISVGAGDVAIGSPTFLGLLDQHNADNETNGTNEPFFALEAAGDLTNQDLKGDIFVATGHLALESWNSPPAPGSPNSVGFFVENTSSTIAGGTGSRVIGVTYIGGFWNGIGLYGTFNGVTGQNAALQSFVTGPGTPTGGRQFPLIQDVPGPNPSTSALDITNAIGAFAFNRFNLANGCPIGAQGFAGCNPTTRITLLLDIEDGSLLAFRFQDDEEEEDDPFSNRGDEEDWQ